MTSPGRPCGTESEPTTEQPSELALQVWVSRTATLPSALATYAVWRLSSTAIAIGSSPTLIVGCGPAHPEPRRELQGRTSIIATLFVPDATYAVCTGADTATPRGASTRTLVGSRRQPERSKALHRAASNTE